MGMKTELHEAAERGESEELQLLLDTGAYDVDAGDEFRVRQQCERETEREREKERVVLTDLNQWRGREGEEEISLDSLFLPSYLHSVDCVR